MQVYFRYVFNILQHRVPAGAARPIHGALARTKVTEFARIMSRRDAEIIGKCRADCEAEVTKLGNCAQKNGAPVKMCEIQSAISLEEIRAPGNIVRRELRKDRDKIPRSQVGIQPLSSRQGAALKELMPFSSEVAKIATA